MNLILNALLVVTFIGVIIEDYRLRRQLDYLIELLERE